MIHYCAILVQFNNYEFSCKNVFIKYKKIKHDISRSIVHKKIVFHCNFCYVKKYTIDLIRLCDKINLQKYLTL